MILQNEENVTKQLDEVIVALGKKASVLKRSSIWVMMTTFLNLVCALIIIGIYIANSSNSSLISNIKYVLFFLNVIFLIQALIYLYWFDQKKKSGDIIYEEASDYYEWLMKKQLANAELIQFNTILLKLKVAFREYTRSADLPLAPGKRGIGMYVAINIISIMTVGLSLVAMASMKI